MVIFFIPKSWERKCSKFIPYLFFMQALTERMRLKKWDELVGQEQLMYHRSICPNLLKYAVFSYPLKIIR